MQRGQSVMLNTGAPMPIIGLGTWESGTDMVGKAIEYAISECGYRHIDCAAVYENEREIGVSLRKIFGGTIQREDVFITGKLWNSAHKRGDVRPACKATLADLGLRYLDLYLVHWGMANRDGKWATDENGFLKLQRVPLRETWEAMEELVKAGLVKAIGVSNFTVSMLIDLLSYARIPPAVNQVELHPYLQQTRLVEFCQYRDIMVTAYSPLGRPGSARTRHQPLIKEDATIKSIAARHGKTATQVMLRWGIQRNTVVIPKSIHPERMRENISIFDFELSETEIKEIAKLDRHYRFVDPYEWGKIPYFD